jgi:hypothetical protein
MKRQRKHPKTKDRKVVRFLTDRPAPSSDDSATILYFMRHLTVHSPIVSASSTDTS